ncbi:hypothetical protein AGDE_11212 [Angomonas deanei]|uniref:COPI associated protein, putative n=1 Tax=Angomonas deanei TaxID=59799 RepID=A0A7G2CP00_9TRYP|nr:hypothetical protein AGDE_11212 [Angomonas deanei]CAD2220273.1 COPI associated protein, putative [Angomonas deanei]|eukprot:EPY26550.1 hypothetical protein AGDE_11212 [Angomonas deanei]
MDSSNFEQTQQRNTNISSNFFVRQSPRIFLAVSFVIAVLTFVGVIVSLTKLIVKPHIVLQDVYCLIFSLLCLSAELRQFGWCRKIVYKWLRFFYALTCYRFRGLFYVFFGLLLLGYHAVMYVAGALAIALGLAIFVLTFFTTLPTYEDAEEIKRNNAEGEQFREEEVQREEESQHGIGVGGVFQSIGNKISSSIGQGNKKESNEGKTGNVPPPAQPAPTASQGNSGFDQGSSTSRIPSAAAAMFGSPETTPARDGLGPTMFQSATSRAPPPPVREEGITRADSAEEEDGAGESHLRRQFNQGMQDSHSSADLKN